MNIVVTNLYRSELRPPPAYPRMAVNNPTLYEKIQNLDEEKRELLKEYRENDLRNFRKITFVSLIPLSFVSFAGGYIIAGQMLSPLKELNKKIKNINVKSLKGKLRYADNEDEISELIKNFNDMIARLNISFEAQKEFIENASHELKTPLAIIQTNLDSILLDDKISKSDILSLVETSKKSIKFMNKLTEDLLLLALLENHIKKKKIDLKEIVKESQRNLNKIAIDKEIRLDLTITGKDFVTQGNSELLQRAIMNLIENAIKYSPEKSTVKIEMGTKNDRIIVSIIDQGDGIGKEDHKRIFERFYRVDKSRSRQTGGAGLGLAIAKKIVELHKGKLILESKKRKGSTFTISLNKRED
ncbi:MAG: ATP-binding protein [Candidatus Dojkabacteria bacterium]|nr:ATP-binding protein [Candidatus Dojkabacteria bacterium]